MINEGRDELMQELPRSAPLLEVDLTSAKRENTRRLMAVDRRRTVVRAAAVASMAFVIVGLVASTPALLAPHKHGNEARPAASVASSENIADVSMATSQLLLQSCLTSPSLEGAVDVSNWRVDDAGLLPPVMQTAGKKDNSGQLTLVDVQAPPMYFVTAEEQGGALRAAACVLEGQQSGQFMLASGGLLDFPLDRRNLPSPVTPLTRLGLGNSALLVGAYGGDVRSVKMPAPSGDSFVSRAKSGIFVAVLPDGPKTYVFKSADDRATPPLPQPRAIIGVDADGREVADVNSEVDFTGTHSCWKTPAGVDLKGHATRIVTTAGSARKPSDASCGAAVQRSLQ